MTLVSGMVDALGGVGSGEGLEKNDSIEKKATSGASSIIE